ncbi:DUF3885 domain-containing protein [Parapedobacter koreensis]|uniref:DUF3885 domain-containing protein n=1 Tax=Parapedobacter koreensis TaxID=332977 RepID=A0A1H7UFV5_9SPHI|nr:DUF3885 domain-containing protein [Parapedobacter koreensis]SEL95117.1 protein of unknown function [Parapedobacter koreensis]
MEIKNSADLEGMFIEKFGDIPKTTLSSITDHRVRLGLGEDLEDELRIQQALDRSAAVLDYCFGGKGVWLIIILWGANELSALETAGINPDKADKKLEWKENDYDVLCLHYEQYSFRMVSPIVASIINYELVFEPSANITCYFVDFTESLIVNIYDDRGCDIYSPNEDIVIDLSNRFTNWVNK